jgi:peptidoglycan/LPS O-acetylase OafA/YrhL
LENTATIGLQQNRDFSWGYRPAIDGLRSVAVISVLLFHFNRNLLGGGFVGVDVFFVLSGYLLTSILLLEIKAGNFSIARFYQRCIARIFPAFFIVIVITLGLRGRFETH